MEITMLGMFVLLGLVAFITIPAASNEVENLINAPVDDYEPHRFPWAGLALCIFIMVVIAGLSGVGWFANVVTLAR